MAETFSAALSQTRARRRPRTAAFIALVTLATAILVVSFVASRDRASAAALPTPLTAATSPKKPEEPLVVTPVAPPEPTPSATASATAKPSSPKAKLPKAQTPAKKAAVDLGVPKAFDDVQ
jgi:hypothetical protein